MNYEANMRGGDTMEALPGYGEAKPRRRWLMIGGLVVVILIAVLVATRFMGGGEAAKGEAGKKGPAAAGKRGAQIPTVTVAVPGRQTITRVVTGTGSIAARREMPVGVAGEGGLVTRVLVEPGTWVRAGQVLATVDRSVQSQNLQSLAANVRVAQADAELAQNELERSQALVSRGFVSRADVDRKTAARDAARARVNVAQATLSEARARTARLDIRSPAAGLVLTRGVEPGQIVSAGSGALFRVAQGGQMELRTQLSEGDLQAVSTGNRAEVNPVGTDQKFSGEVWQVAPVVDPQTRQGIARVALSYDRALRPGGFASASIVTGAVNAPLLPESAVLSDSKGNFVYVIDSANKVVRRDVTTGEVSDAGVAITSGLAGTERVVMRAGAFLNPGQTVKPVLSRSASR